MGIKTQLTDVIGTQLGWSITEQREKHNVIWQNPRKKIDGGYRLTE